MSTDCLKLENNLCRCCHAEGAFKTLGVSIGTQGREVYADMLRVYLDVNLTPVPGPLCLVTYTICEECVQRLYDAVDFKKQILECEERFRDMYRRDVIKACKPDVEVKLEVDATDIPSTFVEELKVECNPEINEIDDDTDFEYPDTAEVDAPEEAPKEQQAKTKDLDGKKEDDSKKKDKGKGKAKVVKTGKKIGRPKKSETGAGDKKTKKGPVIPQKYMEYYTVIEEKCWKKYLCLICKNILGSATSLKRHIRLRHKTNSTDCPVCDKKLDGPSKLRKHLLCNHTKEEVKSANKKIQGPARKYICDYCKREFSKKFNIYLHIRENHTLSMCKDCGMGFIKRQMPMHRNDAHGEPMPTCGICGFRTADKERLTSHQRRVHLQEKNISCEHCNMSFFDSGGLVKHLVRHSSERKFACNYCNKTFSRKTTLRFHEKIHTGEKNKVCSVCDQRFVQKSSLNYHMARYHPGVAF